MDRPESFPELVGVLDTSDSFALGMAAAALNEAGIVYDIVGIRDLPANLQAEKPKWWIRPSRILVSVKDASEARSLVEPFRKLRLKSDIEARSMHELVDVGKSDKKDFDQPTQQFLWKGPPDAPFVQRVGARLMGSFFVCCGLFTFYEILPDSPFFAVLLSAGIVALGLWVFLNGLARPSK